MIIPTNEKLFKKWAVDSGLESTLDAVDYASQLVLDEFGHIINHDRVLEIIKQLQVEFAKVTAENKHCIKSSLKVAADVLTSNFGYLEDSEVVKAILDITPETVLKPPVVVVPVAAAA